MSILLSHAIPWLTPLLHPTLSKAGRDFQESLAEWVFEYGNDRSQRGAGVDSISDVDDSRLTCPLSIKGMLDEFRAYQGATGAAGVRRITRGAADALAHGVVTAAYPVRHGSVSNHPHYSLVRILEAAVARAAAVRDVAAHLERHPVDVVLIDGVAPGARSMTGQQRGSRAFVRTTEIHRPWSAAEAADLLLRKVELEHVGVLGGVSHPEWLPPGFVAADLLRQVTEDLTGVPVTMGKVPTVEYRGSRPVVTPELLELVPALESLPARMRLAPVGAGSSSAEHSSGVGSRRTRGSGAPRATPRITSPRPAHLVAFDLVGDEAA